MSTSGEGATRHPGPRNIEVDGFELVDSADIPTRTITSESAQPDNLTMHPKPDEKGHAENDYELVNAADTANRAITFESTGPHTGFTIQVLGLDSFGPASGTIQGLRSKIELLGKKNKKLTELLAESGNESNEELVAQVTRLEVENGGLIERGAKLETESVQSKQCLQISEKKNKQLEKLNEELLAQLSSLKIENGELAKKSTNFETAFVNTKESLDISQQKYGQLYKVNQAMFAQITKLELQNGEVAKKLESESGIAKQSLEVLEKKNKQLEEDVKSGYGTTDRLLALIAELGTQNEELAKKTSKLEKELVASKESLEASTKKNEQLEETVASGKKTNKELLEHNESLVIRDSELTKNVTKLEADAVTEKRNLECSKSKIKKLEEDVAFEKLMNDHAQAETAATKQSVEDWKKKATDMDRREKDLMDFLNNLGVTDGKQRDALAKKNAENMTRIDAIISTKLNPRSFIPGFWRWTKLQNMEFKAAMSGGLTLDALRLVLLTHYSINNVGKHMGHWELMTDIYRQDIVAMAKDKRYGPVPYSVNGLVEAEAKIIWRKREMLG